MATGDRVIESCQELAPGDAIEAFKKNTLVHRGPVTGIAPEFGLFWILDTLTGSHLLVDMTEFEIMRMPARYREVLVGEQAP
jgi:hypothetical protein